MYLSAMKRKNVTCVKELFNCIALMSATSFVGLEKMFLILHLTMQKVSLLPNVWKEGLLKLSKRFQCFFTCYSIKFYLLAYINETY